MKSRRGKGTDMWLIILTFSWLWSCCGLADAALRPGIHVVEGWSSMDKSLPIQITDYVTARYHFGRELVTLDASPVHLLSQKEYDMICSKSSKDELKALQSYRGKVLLMEENLEFSCGGKWGTLAHFGPLPLWCSLGAVVVRIYNEDFPGLYVNQHDGTHFANLYQKEPSLRECAFLEFRPEDSIVDELLSYLRSEQSGEVLVSLQSVPSRAETVFESILVQVLFRILLPGGYFILASLAINFLWSRFKAGKMAIVHWLLFPINGITCVALGVLESQGNKGINDGFAFHIQLSMWTSFFGISAASGLLNTARYLQVVRKLEISNFLVKQQTGKVDTVRCVQIALNTFGWLIIILDVFFSIIIAGVSAGMTSLLGYIVAPLYALIQLAVTISFHLKIKRVTQLLSEFNKIEMCASSNSSSTESKVNQERRALRYTVSVEQRMRFWGTVSNLSGVLFSLIVLCIGLGVQEQSPVGFVVVWFCFNVAKLVNVLSQLYIWKLPSKSRKRKRIVLPTQYHATTTRKTNF